MLVIPARVKVVVVMVSALALAAGLLTLTLLAKPAQAQAQTFTDIERTQFNVFVISCSEEEVFIEGTLHTVAHTTIDANGVIHTGIQFNLKGQGEGPSSGDEYVFHTMFNIHTSFRDNFNDTFTQTTKFIRKGSATPTDDLNGKFLTHVTVNENGEVTAEVVKGEFECK